MKILGDFLFTKKTSDSKPKSVSTPHHKAKKNKRVFYSGVAIDEVISERHNTYKNWNDKHSVREDKYPTNCKITGKNPNRPDSVKITDAVSGNVYTYIPVTNFKGNDKLKQKYGDMDYVLVSATKPDGTSIKLDDHYEVYKLSVEHNTMNPTKAFNKGEECEYYSYRLI